MRELLGNFQGRIMNRDPSHPVQWDVFKFGLNACAFWFCFLTSISSVEGECSQKNARIVRNTMTARDMYYAQERHKYMESASKWVCNFCGKAFYEERFLDMHMNNRHKNMIKTEEDATCLADYCDVFRCDVIQGVKAATYWDVALCKESDLHYVQHKCEKMLTDCLPETISVGIKLKLFEKLNKTVCSYLNCDKYWEVPDSEVDPASVAVYIMLFILVFVGLLIYYYVAYTHFFTDESLLGHEQASRLQGDSGPCPKQSVPFGQEVRYRMATR